MSCSDKYIANFAKADKARKAYLDLGFHTGVPSTPHFLVMLAKNDCSSL